MSGEKTIEIRGEPSSKVGRRIYLAPSREHRIAVSAFFEACQGPLTADEFERLRPRHRVEGAKLPYGARTHAYHLAGVKKCHGDGYRYHRKRGVVKWELVPLADELRHAL